MRLNDDLNEFIRLLLSERVDFLIVGAHALAFHSRPRFTGDLDVWIRCDERTAGQMTQVLKDFGFGEIGLQSSDFTMKDQVIQLGVAPHRLDILTGLSGIEFDQAWQNRIHGKLADHSVYYISKDDLILNKRAVGRLQDLTDVETLENT